MNRTHHHEKAEQLLADARKEPDAIRRGQILAEAQVHATLALSAAPGTSPPGPGQAEPGGAQRTPETHRPGPAAPAITEQLLPPSSTRSGKHVAAAPKRTADRGWLRPDPDPPPTQVSPTDQTPAQPATELSTVNLREQASGTARRRSEPADPDEEEPDDPGEQKPGGSEEPKPGGGFTPTA